MCGICGIWGADHSQAVGAMVRAMHHRGPDDHGVFADTRISLGMARLAIIDTGTGGHQPMKNPDGSVWIVYNGEAYNFQTERKILESKGYGFSSSSDTEVVLRMYEHYGDDFLLRIRGMFALAIYDKRGGPGKERLLLARDQLGIKPLLYAHASGKLIFASEMKALLAGGLVKPEIDPEGLRLLLTFGSIYQPRTILRGVRMLPAAHRMIVDAGGEKIERYWSVSPRRSAELSRLSYEELVSDVAEVLQQAVKLQLVSDVPLGAFLSGGIDSSLLVAMMAQEAGHRIKTFSVGYEAEGAHLDESDEAERTARFIGTDHTKVLVTGAEVRDRIEHIAWGLDQPSVDGVNSYFVAQAARQAVTVSISGNGGDELFAGYPWFIFMAQDQRRLRANPLAAAARSLVARIAKLRAFDALMRQSSGDAILKARGLAGFVTRYGNLWQAFGSMDAARLLSDEIRPRTRAGCSIDADLNPIDEVPDGTTIQRVSALCLRGYNTNQLLRDIDAVSMAHSLEARVPFLDPVVADTALSLPDYTKLGDVGRLPDRPYTYRDSGAKRILFDVGRARLPEKLDLQEKRGFGMPFDSWLKGPLREVFLDAVSERSLRARGLLNVAEAMAARDAVFRGDFLWTRPWLLLMLELWCREVMDKPVTAAANRPSYAHTALRNAI
ncbi:MAG: asparagine synthase (glutamine-hydrolyzing) [Blastocatellia bacterium]